MRIAHISDFHITRLSWNPFRLFPKRVLANLNWLLFRKTSFFEEQLHALIPLFDDLGVDLVVCGGDVSTTSLEEEFEAARTLLKRFPCPWLAIPGNHDKYTFNSSHKGHFYRYFSNTRPVSTPRDFFTLEKQGVEVHALPENFFLVALDTAFATHPYSSQGRVSLKLAAYLQEALALIPPDARILVLNHYPLFQNDEERRELKDAARLQEILRNDSRIQLYLHGHTHRHCIADLRPANFPILLDSGSAASRRGSFNLIDISKKGCQIQPYFWTTQWTPGPTEAFAWRP
jgi:3',5'-cyclic AMP phosphodiesterase CpdA